MKFLISFGPVTLEKASQQYFGILSSNRRNYDLNITSFQIIVLTNSLCISVGVVTRLRTGQAENVFRFLAGKKTFL
jgi:hypothetical protein